MKSPVPSIRPAMLACAAFLCASNAFAAEFKNIGAAPVIMYDAPSTRGQRLFVAPRGMPVEVVINYGTWSKVRDFAGDLSWVETRELAERKNVLIRTSNTKIRIAPDESSSVQFSADKGVLLEFVETYQTGWIKVKHSDSASGYVKLSDVWGV